MIARKVRKALRARMRWARWPVAREYFEVYERALFALSPDERAAFRVALHRTTGYSAFIDTAARPANDNARAA